jgi:hypothetical protein
VHDGASSPTPASSRRAGGRGDSKERRREPSELVVRDPLAIGAQVIERGRDVDGVPGDDRLTPHPARGASPGDPPGQLTLGTDNGSAFTAGRFRQLLSGLGIAHRRGGYREPESQAFIESWFRYLKERVIWRNEFETIDQARAAIGAYVETAPTRASTTARRRR